MTLEKLKAAFVEALGISPATDFDALRYRSVEQWDSVGHMQLVAALERAFDVMLETDDVIGMSSFARARDILAKHGVVF